MFPQNGAGITGFFGNDGPNISLVSRFMMYYFLKFSLAKLVPHAHKTNIAS
jgi:hypothetical protein